jgi:hypothetical protein
LGVALQFGLSNTPAFFGCHTISVAGRYRCKGIFAWKRAAIDSPATSIERARIDVDRVTREFARIAFVDIADFVEWHEAAISR